MKPDAAISYLRVSTRSQGDSGLGIDAQRNAVDAYCKTHGLELLDEYAEIESGSRHSRPVLLAAIARAEATGALLLIARLDRLTRSNDFLNKLLANPDLRFAACDIPEADRFVLQVLSAVAEREAAIASDRTKRALAAAKARGVVLGKPENLTAYARKRGADATNAKLRDRRDRTDKHVRERIVELKNAGLGFKAIARALNDERFRSPARKPWNAMTAWRTFLRVKP